MSLVNLLVSQQQGENAERFTATVKELNQCIQQSAALFLESPPHMMVMRQGLRHKNMASFRRGLNKLILCRGFLRVM